MTALVAAIAVLASGPVPAGPDPAPAVYQVPEPWASLAVCESGMGGVPRWRIVNPPYSGGLQVADRTWAAFRLDGYPDRAWQAPPREQVAVAERVQAAQGWGSWPSCSRQVGLR